MSKFWRNIATQSSIKASTLFIVVAVIVGFLIIPLFVKNKTIPDLTMKTQKIHKPLRYISLGDSYTFGANEKTEDSFPVQLTTALGKEGIDVTLVTNPAVSGYTTQDVIDEELEVLNTSDANFVTLLIGANDIAQQVDAGTFRTNLTYILDSMLQKIQNKDRIIVLTIPDFSVTPVAKKQGFGLPVQEAIESFNAVIKEEATKRGLIVVDLFDITKEMGKDSSLINADGLHPSAKEYSKWVELLVPAVKSLI